MLHPLFMNQKNRNAYVKKLKAEGQQVRKTRITNQLLHPQYVADYEQETGIQLTTADKGFGNTIYKTSFGVLYSCGNVNRIERNKTMASIIKEAVAKRYVLDKVTEMRPYLGITRVSSEYLKGLDGRVRAMIQKDIHSHPSIGKTFKP